MNWLINTFLGGFKNWQTTLVGVVTAIVYILHTQHIIDVPQNVQTGLVAVVIFVVGWVTKDNNQAGTAETDAQGTT